MIYRTSHSVKSSGRVGIALLHRDIRIGNAVGEFGKRHLAILKVDTLNRRRHLLEVGLQDREEQRLLVRKILVKCADRNPGTMRYSRGRQSSQAIRKQNLNRCLIDRLNRRSGSRLDRRFPYLEVLWNRAFQNTNTQLKDCSDILRRTLWSRFGIPDAGASSCTRRFTCRPMINERCQYDQRLRNIDCSQRKPPILPYLRGRRSRCRTIPAWSCH